MTDDGPPLIAQQLEYYRKRAPEYDEWFFRKGRYDRGVDANNQWFAEVDEVRAALEANDPSGHILELACGTGLWTQVLASFAGELTAVDSSPEMLARCRERLQGAPIRFIEDDIFSWTPDRQYDFVFFSFWLSHVPPENFQSFWSSVSQCLTPQGCAFFVDSLYIPNSTAQDHHLGTREAVTQTRRLNDGQEFEVVKVYYTPQKLNEQLGKIGWSTEIGRTSQYFLYGSCHLPDQ